MNCRRVCSSDLAPLSARAMTLEMRAQHIGMKAALAFQELPALVSALSSFLPLKLSPLKWMVLETKG